MISSLKCGFLVAARGHALYMGKTVSKVILKELNSMI